MIPVIQRPGKLNRDWIIDKEQCRALIHVLLDSARTRLPRRGVSLSGIQKNGFSIVRLVEAMQEGSVLYRAEMDKRKTNSFLQFFEFCVVN